MNLKTLLNKLGITDLPHEGECVMWSRAGDRSLQTAVLVRGSRSELLFCLGHDAWHRALIGKVDPAMPSWTPIEFSLEHRAYFDEFVVEIKQMEKAA